MKYIFGILFIFVFGYSNAQTTATTADERIGLIKTVDGKTLGYGFVAMNKNVIFTAADNITFDQEMVFKDQIGKTYPLRVVATDKVGNIAVLMANEDIHIKPFNLNLNYAIDGETDLYGFENETPESYRKTDLELIGKNSKIQKSKEFKFIQLFVEKKIEYTGMPILNVSGEVIGLISKRRIDSSDNSVLTGSIMDGQMWKKM